MPKYERFIDQFFDENNMDNVKLEDNDGKMIEFEQVAVVDFDEHYYTILHAVTPLVGVAEDEALVFLINEKDDVLVLCEDEEIIEGVFAVYYDMLDSEED